MDFVRRQVSVGRNLQILPSYRARVKRCGQFLGFSVRYPLKMLTTFIRYWDIVDTVCGVVANQHAKNFFKHEIFGNIS